MYQSHYADTRTNAVDGVPFAHVLAPLSYAGEGVYLVIAAIARVVGQVCRRVTQAKADQANPASY